MTSRLASPRLQSPSRRRIQGWPDPDLPVQYPVTSGWVDIDAGIDSTGATDVTAALTAAIEALDGGGKLRLALNGTYRVDSGIQVTGLSNVSIDGNGATLYQPTLFDAPILQFELSDDVYVTGLNILGAITQESIGGRFDANFEANTAIRIEGGTRHLYEDCQAEKVGSDIVTCFRSSLGSVPGNIIDGVEYNYGIPTHITARNFRQCYDPCRQGLTVVHGQYILYENIPIDRCERSLIDLEPIGGPPIKNFTVRDCVFGERGNNFIAAGGAPVLHNNVAFINLTATGTLSVTVAGPGNIGARRNYIFRNISAPGARSGNQCMTIRYIDGLEVSEVSGVGSGGDDFGTGTALASLYGCTDWSMFDNTIGGGGPEYYFREAPVDYGYDPPATDIGDLPTFVGTDSLTASGSASPRTVPLPASIAADDLLVLVVSGTNYEVSAPSGWTQMDYQSMHEGGVNWDKQGFQKVFCKRAEAADVSAGSVDVTLDAFTNIDPGFAPRFVAVTGAWRNAGWPYGRDSRYEPEGNIGPILSYNEVATTARALLLVIPSQRGGATDWTVGDPPYYRPTTPITIHTYIQGTSGIVSATTGLMTAPIYGVGAPGRRLLISDQGDQRDICQFFVPYATDFSGDAAAQTAWDAEVPPQPTPLDYPTLSGTFQVGQNVVCDPGTWIGGNAPRTFSYIWSASAGAGGVLAETSDTLTLTEAEVGLYVYCEVVCTDVTQQTNSTKTLWYGPVIAA